METTEGGVRKGVVETEQGLLVAVGYLPLGDILACYRSENILQIQTETRTQRIFHLTIEEVERRKRGKKKKRRKK